MFQKLLKYVEKIHINSVIVTKGLMYRAAPSYKNALRIARINSNKLMKAIAKVE